MIRIRKSSARGKANFGWLDSRHTFSFGDYQDLEHMGFGPLRVINEDRVAPGGGFGTHGHRDMEIISYVLEGALEHKDSIGTGAVIRPREIQRMTAGTGIRHSEHNFSATEPVHFLQIWIEPAQQGLKPGYEQISLEKVSSNAGGPEQFLRLVAGPDGAPGTVTIHQDVRLYLGQPPVGSEFTHATDPARGTWIQVIRGSVLANGAALAEGDGAALSGLDVVTIKAESDAEFLLFDLPLEY